MLLFGKNEDTLGKNRTQCGNKISKKKGTARRKNTPNVGMYSKIIYFCIRFAKHTFFECRCCGSQEWQKKRFGSSVG
ncbi:MAG: hypothetical protein EBU82_11145 [Flavobacteriia bacterium]|nr:hypothetical protein [Flavobacteriia bacterium]